MGHETAGRMGRRWWKELNYPMYVALYAICAMGLLALYSSTGQTLDASSDTLRQLVFLGVGTVLMILLTTLDYEVMGRLAVPLYIVNVCLLAVVLLPGVGQKALGAQRWVSVGPLGTFQPSELAKLLFIITLARHVARYGEEDPARARHPKVLGMGLLHVSLLFVMVMLQPDLGTALVFMAVLLVVMFVAGVHPAWLLGVVAAGLATAPFVLKEYQRDRLTIFMNPERDPRGDGYHLLQSMTAIGSGQVQGDGIFSGHMTQFHFVPEQRTDFIFTAIGEELGFIGGAGLLLLYLCLLLAILYSARRARDMFGTMLCAGVGAMLTFHVFVNIGMTLGIMPVTGIPLPFASYGGSALLTNLMALGVVGSVHLRGRPWNMLSTEESVGARR